MAMSIEELADRITPHLKPGRFTADEVRSSLYMWQQAGAERLGRGTEIAAQFQRPGRMKLPQNICMVLGSDEVVSLKFNPRNSHHPLEVAPRQVGEELERRPRGSVRVGTVEAGGMTSKVTFLLDGEEHPMRCPPLRQNPAACAVIVALGGELG